MYVIKAIDINVIVRIMQTRRKTHNICKMHNIQKGRKMAMTPEAKAEKAKYMREWRRKNPGKQREYEEKKWERKAQAAKAEREAARNAAAE